MIGPGEGALLVIGATGLIRRSVVLHLRGSDRLIVATFHRTVPSDIESRMRQVRQHRARAPRSEIEGRGNQQREIDTLVVDAPVLI